MLSQKMIMDISKKYGIPMERVCVIADICEKHGFAPYGNVFRRSPEDLEELIGICKKYNLNPDKSRLIFGKVPETIRDIISVCEENYLKIKPEVFTSNPKHMRESAEYIRTKFGQKYVTLGSISRKVDKLKQSMPIIRFLGLLDYCRMDASIFDLNQDEIIERSGVLHGLEMPLHKPNKELGEDRVHRVYTLSKAGFENFCEARLISERDRKLLKHEFQLIIKSAIAQIKKKKPVM